jgi:hypothetical protein
MYFQPINNTYTCVIQIDYIEVPCEKRIEFQGKIADGSCIQELTDILGVDLEGGSVASYPGGTW